jgi:antitoxin HigA-1
MNGASSVRPIPAIAASNCKRGSPTRLGVFESLKPKDRTVLKNTCDLDLDFTPPHPGEILREDVLPRLNLRPAALARRLRVPVDTIIDILAERRPMTRDIAGKLERAFGHSFRFWLGLQLQYDRWINSMERRPA